MYINDLIYLDDTPRNDIDKIKKAIKADYPKVSIREDWDDIHGTRLVIDIDVKDKREWLEYAFRKGLALQSFYFQMTMMEDDRKIQVMLSEIITENKDLVDTIIKR